MNVLNLLVGDIAGNLLNNLTNTLPKSNSKIFAKLLDQKEHEMNLSDLNLSQSDFKEILHLSQIAKANGIELFDIEINNIQYQINTKDLSLKTI